MQPCTMLKLVLSQLEIHDVLPNRAIVLIHNRTRRQATSSALAPLLLKFDDVFTLKP
jgi:hypothetical protein